MKGKRLMAIILSAVLTMTSMSSVTFAEDTYDAEAAAVVETEMVAEYEEPVVVEEKTVPVVEEVVEETEIEVPVEEQEEITTEEVPVEEVETTVDETAEPVYPAQSFASAANGVSVEVSAPEGAFPENTTMYVAPANYSAVVAAAEAVDAPVEDVKAVDITFMNAEGTEIEPLSAINVSLKSSVIAESNEAVIVHVDDNNVAEVVTEDKIVEESYNEITFAADEFSVYAIVPNDPRAFYEFYVDGVLVETQIVKAGDELVEPAEPAGEGHFLGWFNGDAQVTFGIVSSVTGGQTVRVDAKFTNTIYVTFYDADRNSVVAVKIPENGSVTTSDVTAQPIEIGTAFDGWATADGTKVGESYEISANTALYPVFVSGKSLTFDANGDGATQTPIQYVKAGQTTVRPADPQRPGYTFAGWSTTPDAATAVAFTFGQALTADTTVYAIWEPAAADFTVIVWKQKITDKAGSDEKTYDYEASYVGLSTTGASVAVANTYKNYKWDGFHYASCDDAKTVANDGSTVLNVYYDRDIITMIFNGIGENQYTYTATTSNSGTQYGYVNGEYVQLTRESNSESYLSTSKNGSEYTGDVYIRTREGGFLGIGGTYVYKLAYPPYNNSSTYYYKSGGNSYSELRWVSTTTYSYTVNGTPYTGTRYTRSSSTTKQTTYIGLYGQTLQSQGYSWPSNEAGTSSVWKGNGSSTNTTFMDAFLPTDGKTQINYVSQSSGNYTRYFYKQNVDGSWPSDSNPTNTAKGSANSFSITNKYNGFTAYQYKVGTSDSWHNVTSSSVSQTTSNAIYIRFKRNSYKIDFVNGTNTVKSQNYLFEASLKESDAPTNLTYPGNVADADHYNFAGWYADPEGTTPFDFSIKMPANNLVAYAKWEPEKITVTYDANGGTADKESEEINYNAKATGANAAWEGHSFLGWETEEGNTWSFESPVTGDMILKAAWRNNNKMTVAYVDADGTTVITTDTNEYIDGARAIVVDYTNEDGRFIGWTLNGTVYYAGDVINVNSANDTADGSGDNVVTLTAVYDELLTTSIIFDANGGAFADAATEKTVTLENNEGVDLDSVEVPVKEGYKFLGWAETADAEEATYTPDGTAAEEIAADASSANTLYAIWIGQFKVYHSSDCKIEEYDLVDSFDITNCVYDGYMYGGYYKDYAGKGTPYTGASSSWSAADAYIDYGTTMVPVAGETYYLKEVPDAYVQASNYEIYHIKTGVEKKFYLVSTIDDANYSAVGFKVGASETDLKSTLTSAWSISYKDPSNSADYWNSTVYASDFNNVPAGLITYIENNTILTAGKSVVYRPYFTTLDGVQVYGKLQRTAKSNRKVNPVTHDSITITNKYF